MGLKEILEYALLHIGEFKLTVIQLFSAAVVIFIAKFAVKFISRFVLQNVFKNEKDVGRKYSIQQFLKYIIYTIAIITALQVMGINLSLLMASMAALLVGMSLGLQQLFLDWISGIILLIEGTVGVGDIVLVDGVVGKITKIALRTSSMETIDKNSIIVPNSKFVAEKVTNWSHNKVATRFKITVGVGYQSDAEMVKSLLLQAAIAHSKVLDTPAPSVQFTDFGDSSLQMDLYFFTHELLHNEVIKSELRFTVNKFFRKNQVEIPFPQRDLWIRNGEQLASGGIVAKGQEVLVNGSEG